MINKIKPELLAPAGDLETLKIAYIYGADACYAGGLEYSLRAGANNFSIEDLSEGIAIANQNGKKLYVALNIFAHNEDIPKITGYLQKLAALKPHGIIVSDPGVYSLCETIAPQIPLHISTQANNTNWLTAKFWEKQNAKRIVLARELSLEEITDITSKCHIETEVFIHGAMCMAYSGRCLMSNYILGRNANKGNCAQPCRWKYHLVEEDTRKGEYFPVEEDYRGTYIFNSRDLCLINFIPSLIDANITAFKIEGRNKSAYYTANVTRIYRAAIDTYFKNKDSFSIRDNWLKELESISHRGYTEGFFAAKPAGNMHRYDNGGYIREFDFCGIAHKVINGMMYVEQRNHFTPADDLEIILPDTSNIYFKPESIFGEDMLPIKEVIHPRQKVLIPTDLRFPTPAIIRRKRHD